MMRPPDLPPAAPAFDCELLTAEQFAERLHVSRATVFGWMQRGVLTAGRHFIRLGRIVRFPWTAELIGELLQTSTEPEVKIFRVRTARPKRTTQGCAVNLDY